MQYEKLVPSIDLCEEMARLGICQDKSDKVYWTKTYYGTEYKLGFWDFPDKFFVPHWLKAYIIAPTLSRMMDKLPWNINTSRLGNGNWLVYKEVDKHLPNALAKALIALKKG